MGRPEKASKYVRLLSAAENPHSSMINGVYSKREVMKQIAEHMEGRYNFKYGVDFNDYDIEDAMNFYEWNFSQEEKKWGR